MKKFLYVLAPAGRRLPRSRFILGVGVLAAIEFLAKVTILSLGRGLALSFSDPLVIFLIVLGIPLDFFLAGLGLWISIHRLRDMGYKSTLAYLVYGLVFFLLFVIGVVHFTHVPLYSIIEQITGVVAFNQIIWTIFLLFNIWLAVMPSHRKA